MDYFFLLLVRSVEGYSFESCYYSVIARVSRRISRRISGGFERFSRRFLPDCLSFPSKEGTYDGHRVKVQSVRPSRFNIELKKDTFLINSVKYTRYLALIKTSKSRKLILSI